MPIDSRLLFALFVGTVALARLAELRIAKRNTAALRARGAIEVGAGHYRWMVLLHTAFLVAAPLEVFLFERPWSPTLGALCLAIFAVGMATRYWVIRTLGERWTTRVLALPEEPLIDGGPYRWLRHPNYVAVALEILALPLIHGAWWTAIAFSLLNAWLLRVRIGVEDGAIRPEGRATVLPGASR